MIPQARPSAAVNPTCEDLNDLRRNQLRLLRELRFFMLSNELNRPAKEETSVWSHYAIVLVIVLLESVANSYFFAKGNEFGFLGGIIQAMFISLVNVGVAVAVGRFWLPQKNHIAPGPRLLGYLSIPVHMVFAIVFNLIAAHYRDLYSASPDSAMSASLAGLMSNPFGLTFDSFMLFTTGLVASALGVWKGYSEDDPYPGYGAADRAYRRAKARFVEMRRQLPNCEYELPIAGEDS